MISSDFTRVPDSVVCQNEFSSFRFRRPDEADCNPDPPARSHRASCPLLICKGSPGHCRYEKVSTWQRIVPDRGPLEGAKTRLAEPDRRLPGKSRHDTRSPELKATSIMDAFSRGLSVLHEKFCSSRREGPRKTACIDSSSMHALRPILSSLAAATAFASSPSPSSFQSKQNQASRGQFHCLQQK